MSVDEFELKLYRKMIKWLIRYVGVDERKPHINEVLYTFLNTQWKVNKQVAKGFVEVGNINKGLLYKFIEHGFDVCTEMGCYVQLYN